jgi:hypothetical protein
MTTRILLLACTLFALCSPCAFAAPPDATAIEFFERKIRPVLVKNCFSCHSAEAKKKKGGLYLDSREALLKGGDTGPAVVPGKSDKSLLIEAIRYKNVDLLMPPREKLSESTIADLVKWVDLGAPWPESRSSEAGAKIEAFDLTRRKKSHWSWAALSSPVVPTIVEPQRASSPIDRFLLATLDEQKLLRAPRADKLTLLRRVYFDLIGLPPKLEQIDEFLKDTSSDALAKVVDRLLASSAFGERWGRHWLDLVRYADSRGHEFDFPIPNAFHYRDYIIRALNSDLPYNQLILEHLAGDLLPAPRRHPTNRFNESILGTSFWFLGEEVHSPVDVRADQADRFDNRIDVFSKTFLGLTISCARCHDHKFDAISTKDYYALYGFLSSSNYRLVRFETLEDDKVLANELQLARQKLRPEVRREVAEKLHGTKGDLLNRLGKKPLAEDDPLAPWVTLSKAPAGAKFVELRNALLAKRKASGVTGIVIVDYAKPSAQDWLPDDVAFGLGPAKVGELQVLENQPRFVERPAAQFDSFWSPRTLKPGAENEPGSLGRIVRAGRTIRTPTFPVTSGKIYALVRGKGMSYASVGSHSMIAGPLHGRVIHNFAHDSRFRWVVHDLSNVYRGLNAHMEFTAESDDFAIAQVLQADSPPALPAFEEQRLLQMLGGVKTVEELHAGYQRLIDAALAKLKSSDGSKETLDSLDARVLNSISRTLDAATSIKNLRAAESALAAKMQLSSHLAPTMQDGSGVDERVFIRGSHKSLGSLAPRMLLEGLSGDRPLSIAKGSGRLELAKQMIDPKTTPFVPRVLANRVWHHLFGNGLVSSVDDFGVMGQQPTHPQLLDYLATRFIDEGWSIKKLIRLIVLSDAYAMSSRRNAEGDKRDADNRTWHRANVRRLQGEAIRDAMLSISGRLDGRMYGRPVNVNLTEFQEGRGRPASGPLDGNGRRSIYLSVRRNFLSPMMLAFDSPAPFSTVGKRTVSNVPAQSLILMNDPFVHQQASLWATREIKEGGSNEQRIRRMFLRAFTREPSQEELTSCLRFVQKQADVQAGWSDLAHALLNVKELLYLQ